MAKTKKEEITPEVEEVKVVENPPVEEEVKIIDSPVEEENKESKFKKVLSELKSFLFIVIIIGVIGGGTWYWYTHIYDGGNKKDAPAITTKDGNIYSYSSSAKHADLSVLGNYLIEREDNYVTKIMDLKTEILFEGQQECNSFYLGVDGALYLVLDEFGENENTVTVYKLDDEELKEVFSISKLGVYYAPILYESKDGDRLIGFAGHYYTQDEYGDDVDTEYISLINGSNYEVENIDLFGNSIRLGVSDEIYTGSDRYVITYKEANEEYIYGLYDLKEGKEVIEPTYEIMKEIDGNRYVVQKNNKAAIIDVNRKILLDYKYDFIDVNDGFFVVGKGNKLAIMDDKYNLVTDFVFEAQSGSKDTEFEYEYYYCCANAPTFVAYKIGDKYVLVTNNRDYGYFEYDKHEAYFINSDGKYDTLVESEFSAENGLIYAKVDDNKFVIYNDNLTEKYELSFEKYDFNIYDLYLINENTIVASSDKNMVYVDYETGEIVDNELEFNKEIDDMVINYMNNKLTIKVDKIEKSFDVVGFDYLDFKEVKDGYYYISENEDKPIYIFVEKGE